MTREHMLAPGERVLVAVSGGPDSVALLHVLCHLASPLRLCLEVAHLQHGIRGDEAEEDARFVSELADSLRLPIHLKRVNLRKQKTAGRAGNLEAMARQERHCFFAAVARERDLGKVALGHTQDEQAETVLMRLLRGSGRRGIGGMAPVYPLAVDPAITIIRPLLQTTKRELLGFLRSRGLPYRLDRTNQDPTFLRNSVRLMLLPQLKEQIDSNLAPRLARLAEIVRDEDVLLDELARASLGKVRARDALLRDRLLSEPRAIQRRILRLWLEESRGDLRGINFDHITAILKLLRDGPAQGRLALPGRWEVAREYETILLQKPSYTRNRLCYSYEYHLGTELKIAEARVIIRSHQTSTSSAEWPVTDMEAVFDARCLAQKIVVRNFQAGDRFRPLGMEGHQKIKELFINKKAPRLARSSWPLVTVGGEIVWIPGFARSKFGKIETDTEQVWHFTAVLTDAQ